MGIFTRMLCLFKADIHGVMDRLEDRDLLMKQYLRDMESELRQKEAHLTGLEQLIREIDRKTEAVSREIDSLEKDLGLSLKEEKDDISKMLIRRQRAQKSSLELLERESGSLAGERDALRKIIDEQKLQYDRLKTKAQSHFRGAEMKRLSEAFSSTGELFDRSFTLSEGEIELELLHRKDALRKGGGS